MEQFEKVRKGLEYCIASNDSYCPDECPYINICLARKGTQHIYVHLFEDALALINAQQERIKALEAAQTARVMTLEEVKAFDWDYCYLEEERLPGKEYRAVCGDYALTCITWPCVSSMRILHGDDRYGKKWRCWTQRPTDEQREAVKWDE